MHRQPLLSLMLPHTGLPMLVAMAPQVTSMVPGAGSRQPETSAAAASTSSGGVLVPRGATYVAELPPDGSWLWMPRLSGAEVCVPAYGLVVAVVRCKGEHCVCVVSDNGRCAEYSLDALRQHGAFSVPVGRVPQAAIRSITDALDSMRSGTYPGDPEMAATVLGALQHWKAEEFLAAGLQRPQADQAAAPRPEGAFAEVREARHHAAIRVRAVAPAG